jgi:hypothetical protein
MSPACTLDIRDKHPASSAHNNTHIIDLKYNLEKMRIIGLLST